MKKYFDPDSEDGNPFPALSDDEWARLRDYSATLTNAPRVHDSRTYRETGIVNDVVPLWGFEKPPPLEWFVEDFLPNGFPAILAGDGGTGKSYLAIYLSLCIVLGVPFFRLRTKQGSVLYVDYELDEAEQKRRVMRVLSGMRRSVDDPELRDRFYYCRPDRPLGTDKIHSHIKDLIESYQTDVTILDSLSIATAGLDHSSSADMTRAMTGLKDWGTVLTLDHISGASVRGNQSQARPIGSVFKHNVARSTATLAKDESGVFVLNFGKSNFGPEGGMITYETNFTKDSVVFSQTDSTHITVKHLKPLEITYKMIQELEATQSGATVEDVVARRVQYEVALAAGTVRNHFTALKKTERIDVRDGHAFTIHGPYKDRESGIVAGDAVSTPKGAGIVREVDAGRAAVRCHDLNGDTIWFPLELVDVSNESTGGTVS